MEGTYLVITSELQLCKINIHINRIHACLVQTQTGVSNTTHVLSYYWLVSHLWCTFSGTNQSKRSYINTVWLTEWLIVTTAVLCAKAYLHLDTEVKLINNLIMQNSFAVDCQVYALPLPQINSSPPSCSSSTLPPRLHLLHGMLLQLSCSSWKWADFKQHRSDLLC